MPVSFTCSDISIHTSAPHLTLIEAQPVNAQFYAFAQASLIKSAPFSPISYAGIYLTISTLPHYIKPLK